MFDKLKRLDKWEKRMLLSCADGVVCAVILFFLCVFTVSPLWADGVWSNAAVILIAAAISAFGYWTVADDLTDRLKPFYCLLISIASGFLFFILLFEWIVKDWSFYFLFSFLSQTFMEHLFFPTPTHELLLMFTVCIYAVASVIFRTAMCVLLEIRNRNLAKNETGPLVQNRYRLNRAAVMIPFLLVSAVCLVCSFLYLSNVQAKFDAMSLYERARLSLRRSMSSQINFAMVFLIPMIYGLLPVWESLNKYVELFGTYVRFNSFRFRFLRLAKSIQVRYEDIYTIEAKFVGKKVLYIVLGCHSFKHKIKLTCFFAKHKQLYAKLYREVIKVNPDVFVNEALRNLLEIYATEVCA